MTPYWPCRIALTIVVLFAVQGRVGFAQFGGLDLGDPVANQQKAFEGQMTVLLEELGRVCDLSDEQKSKLATARKGAISRAMKLWKKEALAAQARFGGAMAARAFGNQEGEEEEEDDEDEDEKIKPEMMFALSSMGIQTDPS